MRSQGLFVEIAFDAVYLLGWFARLSSSFAFPKVLSLYHTGD